MVRQVAREGRLPVVTFFGLNPFIERANGRHYRFLVEGLADIGAGLRTRRVGFVVRRYPHHRLLPFADEVRPAIAWLCPLLRTVSRCCIQPITTITASCVPNCAGDAATA